MEILYLLIPIAIIFVIIATRLFIWAVKTGQYDDLDTEGRRILFDDERPSEPGATEPRPQADEKDR